MYPAKPNFDKSNGSKIKIEKLSTLPMEWLKKQETLRTVSVK